MEELRKCPFCGGKAELRVINGFKKEVMSALVTCEQCGASTRSYASTDGAIQAWNRRCCD